MDDLRLILLALGALLIAGIYLYDVLRRRRLEREEAEELDGSGSFLDALDAGREAPSRPGSAESRAHAAAADGDPALGGLDGLAAERDDEVPFSLDDLARVVPGGIEPRPPSDTGAAPPAKRPRAPGNGASRPAEPESELILVLTVMAREGERFEGPVLREALQAAGLEHGDMSIFHYSGEGDLRTVTPAFSVANAVEPGTFDLDALADLTTPGVTLFMRLPSELDGLVAYELMLGAGRRIAEALGGVLCDGARNPLSAQSITHDRERIAEFNRRQRLRAH